MIRRGASFDISFCTETFMPFRLTPSSSAFIPMVVLMQVPSAVATRSVGENASPLPLLSVGASVESIDSDGPCVASQCRSPVYLIEILTMNLAKISTDCHRFRNRKCMFICGHQWQSAFPEFCPHPLRPDHGARSKQRSMKKKVTGEDLRKETPRSARSRVVGYEMTGRTIDQCRTAEA